MYSPLHPIERASNAPFLVSGISKAVRTYMCACGHELRVSGCGRHRIYFEQSEAAPDQPVMSGVCPSCREPLPGKRAV